MGLVTPCRVELPSGGGEAEGLKIARLGLGSGENRKSTTLRLGETSGLSYHGGCTTDVHRNSVD